MLGHFNTRIILTVLFYLVMTPVGFIIRLFRDPLDRSLKDEQQLALDQTRAAARSSVARYERQF